MGKNKLWEHLNENDRETEELVSEWEKEGKNGKSWPN